MNTSRLNDSSRTHVRQVRAADGAFSDLLVVCPRAPARPAQALYWMPAMGTPARYYLGFAQALAARGICVALHEWRGVGSSDRRAARHSDWGYRQLLQLDLPAGLAVARATVGDAKWSLGGHSLGGQLAALQAGLQPDTATYLILVASGSPWWRAFPMPWSVGLRLTFAVLPLLTGLCGYFPGRRIGFGGREARSVMADWARSGRSGRYAATGMDVDMESALAGVQCPIMAIRLREDVFAPAGSLRWLLDKMPLAPSEVRELSWADLDCKADHFSWIRYGDAVAERIADWLRRIDAADAPSS